ncbi:sigma-70 family RNA polymerase sigma factor [Nonomuraea angiospora]|uniref:RNA polymerase sigma factor n=1 Tax=Nonomuraea angiospora TaxID=46172 RepID=UPI0033233F92
MTDELLVVRAQLGERAALAELVERWRVPVWTYVRLVSALSELPVLEREILVLFYLEDLSVEDCAQICRIPAGTVKSRLNRARRLLREHLEEKGSRA